MSIFNTKTSTEEAGITPTLLDAITDAYNRNDINGTRFEGLETIRGIFQGLFNNVESVQWTPIDTRISGDKAYCEFHRIAKLKSGEVQDFLSIDILTFRDGLIIHKDTFYKNRTT